VKHHRIETSRNSARKATAPFLALVLTLAAFFLPASASAIVVRSEIAVFGPDGTATSTFGATGQMTFDQTSRSLYLLSSDPSGIYGFDVSAPFSYPSLGDFDPLATSPLISPAGYNALAVDQTALPSAGNIYYIDSTSNLVYGLDPSGTPLGGKFPIDPAKNPGEPDGSPKSICGVGVDSTGILWVANWQQARLLKYTSAGAFLGSVSTEGQGFRPCEFAFDSNDDLLVTEPGGVGAAWRYTASDNYSTATKVTNGSPQAIAVNPSTHHVFIVDRAFSGDPAADNAVLEYDAAGKFVSRFATVIPGFSPGVEDAAFTGVAVDATNDYVYVSDRANGQIRVYGPSFVLPDLELGGVTAIDTSSATVSGTVNPQGAALTDCRFEYVTDAAFDASAFSDLSSGGSVACDPASGSIPSDTTPHPVSANVTGLNPDVTYHFRLAAATADGSIATGDGTFITAAPPLVETTGSPIRSATTAQLSARVYPARSATTYHFEYGSEGPCDTSPCASSEPHAAGSGNAIELVAEQITGLTPGTTYHYRVVADNGVLGSPVFGKDMTVTTRSSDAPLTHGHFPGPPGSDRAWEQVNLPDTGGNPTAGALAISSDGERVIYRVFGGNPTSETGNLNSQFFAQRTAEGWQTRNIYPKRSELVASGWFGLYGKDDLSSLGSLNTDNGIGRLGAYRISPDAPASKIYELEGSEIPTFGLSDDASRMVIAAAGTRDPAHPVPGAGNYLYDITSGTAKMIGLLPGDVVPACGLGSNTADGYPNNVLPRTPHWLSADGSLAFFPAAESDCNAPRLYVRDIEAEETKLISGSPVSGPECKPAFIRSTADAAFFWTKSRLDPVDTVSSDGCAASFADGDIYRYALADGTVECVTCLVEGTDADVRLDPGSYANNTYVAVSADESRAYFNSPNRLLPGATGGGIYRVDLASRELALVAGAGIPGTDARVGQALSDDGSVLVFTSASPALDAVGGQKNGGMLQYYRYDDRDRSLTCVSCPQDGSVPVAEVNPRLVTDELQTGPNITPLSADGMTFAFVAPTPLVSADQNTARPDQNPYGGADAYEWRDGKVILVTDGLTNWPGKFVSEAPAISGVSRSGNDVYFTAATQYTPDALDGYRRLYDARIGGGFDFPEAEQPCPLEVCQGVPNGAPEEALPGSAGFFGPDNASSRPRCKKGKVRRKGRCVRRHKKHRKRATTHHGRTHR